MNSLIAILIPVIVVIAIAAIVLAIAERFSPDPLATIIIKWIVFAVVLIFLLSKLIPLIR